MDAIRLAVPGTAVAVDVLGIHLSRTSLGAEARHLLLGLSRCTNASY